jgi:endogenous inhibitor of DNA gyrase (YacG/DUF329 family)
MKHRCPVCHKIVKASLKEQSEEAKFFPFCSERCKLIDLGAWLDAEYKIVCGTESEQSDGSSEAPPPTSDTE